MSQVELPDDELAAVVKAIRGVIEDDKYPLSPRLDPLRAALARLEAATEATAEPDPDPKPTAGKADKRARR